MNSVPEPLQRVSLDPDKLMDDFPPELEDINKKIVFEIAHPPGSRLSGKLDYTRWDAMELPSEFDLCRAMDTTEGRADIYDYQPVHDYPSATEWHVNFADRHLFVAYGSGLFAQDEMQVAEHPVLGSLSEYLIDHDIPSSTAHAGSPTPVLVSGASRSCQISTDANPLMERPFGLYGNEFEDASENAVRMATRRIEPPTNTNIIAMAAPELGWGEYTPAQTSYILSTAFTGFRAAVLESGRLQSGDTPVVAHTGYWGCGAFGGNRELMAMLQMLAAEMAGISRLVFHTVNDAGLSTLNEAKGKLNLKEISSVANTEDLVTKIVDMRFQWGLSNGT